MPPYAPVDDRSGATFKEVRAEFGKGFLLSRNLLVTPVVQFGYRVRNRELGADQVENYRNFLLGLAAHIDYAAMPRLVLRGRLGWAETVAPAITFNDLSESSIASGVPADLRSRPIRQAAAAIDYRVFQSLHAQPGLHAVQLRPERCRVRSGRRRPSAGAGQLDRLVPARERPGNRFPAMRRHLLAAALITLVPWSSIEAQDCNAAADQSTMSQCADLSFRKADASLNATYRRIVARLKDDAATRKSLLTAQRAWLAFRDAECAFSSSGVATGSVYPMIVAGCREDLTIERDKELQRFLHCAEGDLGCPVPKG